MANLAYIQVVRRCDQRCRFCSNPENGRDLPLKEAKRLIDAEIRRGCDGIVLTGGEPTLYAGLPDLIAHAARKGVECRVITNAQRTAERPFLERLLAAGLASIHVSIHSHRRAVQAFVSGRRDSLDNIVRTLFYLRPYAPRVGVFINQTICAHNADHIDETARWLCRHFPFLRHFSWTFLDPQTDRVARNPDVLVRLADARRSTLAAMRFLEKTGRTFRMEKIPLCYMGKFAHCSTETRAIVKGDERAIRFLDDRGLYRERGWSYSKAPQCGGCSLDAICAGLWCSGRGNDPAELKARKTDPKRIVSRILGR